MEYLFNILNLCEIDPFKRGADFEMFRIIISLAEKIRCLDDEWFFNVLPQLDIKSVISIYNLSENFFLANSMCSDVTPPALNSIIKS